MNTRQYPPTVHDGYQNTADYASSVTRFDRRDSFTYVASGLAAVALLLILFVWG